MAVKQASRCGSANMDEFDAWANRADLGFERSKSAALPRNHVQASAERSASEPPILPEMNSASVPTAEEIEEVARQLDRMIALRQQARNSSFDGLADVHPEQQLRILPQSESTDPSSPSTPQLKFYRGFAGFLKSLKKSGDKTRASKGHRTQRGSRSSEESPLGSFNLSSSDPEIRGSIQMLSSSDDSSVDFFGRSGCNDLVDGAVGYQTRESGSLLLDRGAEKFKTDGSNDNETEGSRYSTKSTKKETHHRQKSHELFKKETFECRKPHRRLRSHELFRLPELRPHLSSADSYFFSGKNSAKIRSNSSDFSRGRMKEEPKFGKVNNRRWSSEELSWTYRQKIDLEGRHVDSERPDAQIAALSQTLMFNSNVLELNLSWNMIGDSGAQSIAAFLSTNGSLKMLNLSKNWKLGDDGGIALANALLRNRTLEHLSLMSCKYIGDRAAEAFARALAENSGLLSLSLGDCRVGSRGMTKLARALCVNSSLAEMNLSHNSFGLDGTTELAVSLRSNSSLRSLDIRACGIGDEGAFLFGAALCYNSSLESLYLSRNNIMNSGATALASTLDENSALLLLDLSDNHISIELLGKVENRLKKNKREKMRVTVDATESEKSRGDEDGICDAVVKRRESESSQQHAISSGRNIMHQIVTTSPAPVQIPLEYLEHCTDNFSDQRKLGQGAFGEVFLGIDKILRRRFAVKRMKLSTYGDDDDARRSQKIFRREIEAFKCFQHPNIARLHVYHLADDLRGSQCLVFDLAAHGSLDSFLGNDEGRNQLHWTTRINIAAGISKALKYLHQGDAAHFGCCFHGDIKPHNICLKRDFTPLLIDCGLSVCFPTEDSEMTLSVYDTTGNHTRGTVGYICPTYAENFALGRSHAYTGACDVFALGIVLAELVTGHLQRSKVDGEEVHIFDMYSRDGDTQKNLEEDADELAGPWHDHHRRKFAEIALDCIRKDPAKRPGIREIEARISSLSSSAKPWTAGEKNSLAFLFSTPLAWMDVDGHLQPVSKLNVEREMHLVRRCVRESKKDIKLSFDAATCGRLQELVSARYGCLHFAGHGMPCSTLVFEDGLSGCHFVSDEDLAALIPHSEPFKFVFVSACHSENIGKAFVSAGVKHVLCCEHESELLDDAAAAFTRAFYGALCSGYTIKHAFDAGTAVVLVKHNERESKKFILLPPEEDHDVPVFDAAALDWDEECALKQRVPSPVIFEGREIVMNKAISTILMGRRLVTLVGKRGIGRSSLALSIASYMQERIRTLRLIDNIFYVGRRDGSSGLEESLICPLLDQLVAAGLAKESSDEDVAKVLCNALCKSKALIVLDDLDGMEGKTKAFLRALFGKASKVQLICVAKKPIHFISGAVIEKVLKVGPLDPASSARLFGKICPFADTAPKRERLSKSLLCEDETEGGFVMHRTCAKIVDTIHEGFPTKIIEAAKSMSEEDYDKLSRQAAP